MVVVIEKTVWINGSSNIMTLTTMNCGGFLSSGGSRASRVRKRRAIWR